MKNNNFYCDASTTGGFSLDDYARMTRNFSKFFSFKTIPPIDKVIFQKEHTIVLWGDNTKTVVRCFEENFDKEKGLAMAICKKCISRADFNRLIENAINQDK